MFKKLNRIDLILKKSYSQLVEIINKKTCLELVIRTENGVRSLIFNPHWLRFNCQSDSSRQISTGQRIINVDKTPIDLKIKSVEKSNENLYIKWDPDQDQSVLPLEYLINNYPSEIETTKRYSHCKSLKFFDYNKLVDSRGNRNEVEIFKWLEHLIKYGVNIVQNLPGKNHMVKNLAELIAPVQNTIYDQIFDVKVDKNPINIAYSNAPLEFHMDLMYYESAPGIQFLHCLKFDPEIVGGESLFVDSFEVAQKFCQIYPELFEILTKIPATFKKVHVTRTRPVYMFYQRPHIVLNHRKEIIGVNWAPAFEGPLLNLTQHEIESYYKSYLTFSKFINSSTDSIEYKLKPGEVACFNNRRILHARNGFTQNNGVRHFQGCYLNIDEFKSEVLVKEYQTKHSGKNVDNVKLELRNINIGNQDYF